MEHVSRCASAVLAMASARAARRVPPPLAAARSVVPRVLEKEAMLWTHGGVNESGMPAPRLFFSLTGGGAVRRTDFDTRVWKFALVQAGVIPEPKEGERHQAAREHGMHALRHFYASVLLDAGENVKALSTYLGHGDPGFTLRVYTHLMPSSDGRTRRAVDGLYEGTGSAPDGPGTAQQQ
ncbi:hypothetical protein ACFWWS_12195 [Streptomyces sp. NPDC059083]|uniref:hypothetical protein n=1 Tax=unclassified Streptomyces TaxID=2593676 RepID=UPI0036B4729E